MRVKSARRVTLSVLLATLMILMAVSSAFAELTPPGRVDQRSWDPAGNTWAGGTGANKGWLEGETAAMVAEILTDVGVAHDLPICLQVFELPLPTKAYAFTKFAPFNTSFADLAAPRTKPTTLPGGQVIPASFPAVKWDTDDASIWGYNINISSVAPLAYGEGDCDSNEIGVVVSYTRTNNDDQSYIVWGGHIAKAGDALPVGTPDGVTLVPVGKSAAYVIGTCQARLKTSAADKTLNFKLGEATAVVLSGATASAGVPVFALVLVGLVVVGGGVFGLKRLQSR